MNITMEKLAALANVSQGTVSLVLNGKADGQISKAKQEKILHLAEKHHYRVNMAAKSLRKKRQYAIGIVMPCPVNSFYAAMVSRMQIKLAARGYMALFSFWKQIEDIEKAYDAVYSRCVDGIISWTVCDRMLREGIPSVFFDADIEGRDCVRYAFSDAYQELFRYLWGLGHRKIGIVSLPEDSRRELLREFLRTQGSELRQEWCFDFSDSIESAAPLLERLFSVKDRPTALITLNDDTAKRLIFAGSRRGMRFPEELSVAGFMNLSETEVMTPALTTFDSRDDLLTDHLVDQILRRLEQPELPPERITIRPTLILRDSCCAPGQLHND